MTIDEAIRDLIHSMEFRAVASRKNKKGGRYRMFLSALRNATVSHGRMITMLQENGYQIDILPPEQNKQT